MSAEQLPLYEEGFIPYVGKNRFLLEQHKRIPLADLKIGADYVFRQIISDDKARTKEQYAIDYIGTVYGTALYSHHRGYYIVSYVLDSEGREHDNRLHTSPNGYVVRDDNPQLMLGYFMSAEITQAELRSVLDTSENP